jgi:hypothetical protein
VLEEFIDNISNRETALLFWLGILLAWTLSVQSIRSPFVDVLKAFSNWQILPVLTLFLLYIIALIWVFRKAGFWDTRLLKDTIVWSLGTAIIMFFKVHKIKSWNFFKEAVKDNIKWTIVLEFINDFYTFSLGTELFLIPILAFIGLLVTYSDVFDSKLNDSGKWAGAMLKKVLSFIGLIITGFVVYKTFTQTKALLTSDNLKSFLLPVFFTLAFLPFVYLIALFMTYQELCMRLGYLTNRQKDLTKKLKWNILKVANISISKLSNISENIAKPTLRSCWGIEKGW